MLQALAIVWLFSGLRRDEILRLRIGCIRWQAYSPTNQPDTNEQTCLLDVPVNKTSSAFTKPVDAMIGQAIAAWDSQRPPQPQWPDRKTGQSVQFLFCHWGRPVGLSYLNRVLIPLLCQKAGVPREDARGPITSHRARSTIASQLYNAKEPFTLVELQAWLGHSSPESTQHYAKVSPTKLAQSYKDAGILPVTCAQSRCLSINRRFKVGQLPKVSPGSITTWGTVTARMISSTSVCTVWPVQSVRFTGQKLQHWNDWLAFRRQIRNSVKMYST